MRHLASVGADRALKLWDASESGSPYPLHQRAVTNWPEELTWLGSYPVLSTAEQTMSILSGGSYTMVVGGSQDVQQRLTATSSTGAWSISFSSWFNATVTQVVPDTVLCFVKPTLSK